MGKPESSKEDGHFRTSYSLETTDQTKDHYKSWAATYDQEVGVDNGYAQPMRTAQALLDLGVSRDVSILDVGCGSGLSGESLASAGFENIDGNDFSEEMLAVAEAKSVYRSLRFADLNAGQPDIADEIYDVVTAVGVFSFGHVEPDACDDLMRLIKPGGHMIIALNDPFWQKGTLEAKLDALEADGVLRVLSKQFGDHLPGHKVMGWVIVCEKAHV